MNRIQQAVLTGPSGRAPDTRRLYRLIPRWHAKGHLQKTG